MRVEFIDMYVLNQNSTLLNQILSNNNEYINMPGLGINNDFSLKIAVHLHSVSILLYLQPRPLNQMCHLEKLNND